jgi:hypothetical protein
VSIIQEEEKATDLLSLQKLNLAMCSILSFDADCTYGKNLPARLGISIP